LVLLGELLDELLVELVVVRRCREGVYIEQESGRSISFLAVAYAPVGLHIC